MPGIRSLLVASTVAALGLPALADASTYCVEKPACSGLDTTLDGALSDAAATAADDRIELGPVTLPAASYSYAPAIDAGALQIVGSGRTQTMLQNQPASDTPALTVLRGPGGNPLTISALGVRLTTSGDTFAHGIRTAALVDDVAVTTAGAVAGPMIGIDMLTDGVLRDSSVTLQSSGGEAKQRVGVFASETGVLIEAVTVDAPRGIFAQRDVRITRTKVLARGGSAVSACGSKLRIDNSLVRFQSAGPGIDTTASCLGNHASSTEVRQVTLRGDGSAGSTGIGCSSGNDDEPAPILLRGTILDGADDDFKLQTGAAKGSCTVTAGNSRLDLADVKKAGTGTMTLTNQGGNTTVAPGFVNPAIGDFRLKQGSSMIDVGPLGAIDPNVESTVDLLGKPRSVSGNGLGSGRRDMGAYEFQPQGLGLSNGDDPEPPTPPADVPAPADVPPPADSAPTVTPAPIAPAPAAPARPGAAPDTQAPRLSALRLRVGGRDATTIGRTRRASAKLRVALSEGAKLTITVERRSGRRWKRRTALTRTLVPGTRDVALGTALRRAPAGSYRLTVRATDAAGNRSPVRTLRFTIARR